MFSVRTLLVTARQTFWLRGQLRRHSDRIQQKENNFLNERSRIVLTNSGKDSALDLKACWLQSWPCGAEPGLRLTVTVSQPHPVSLTKHKLFLHFNSPLRSDAETSIHQQNIFLARSQVLLRVEYSDRPQGIKVRSDQTWDLRLQNRQEHWTSLTWLSLTLLTLNFM